MQFLVYIVLIRIPRSVFLDPYPISMPFLMYCPNHGQTLNLLPTHVILVGVTRGSYMQRSEGQGNAMTARRHTEAHKISQQDECILPGLD